MQCLRQWTCRGFGSSILTPQPFNESAWLRYHPGGGSTLARTTRVRAGAAAEVPELLLKASSWIPVTKGSECSMNYDRPDVPPALPPPPSASEHLGGFSEMGTPRDRGAGFSRELHGGSRGDGKIHAGPLVMSPAWLLE